MILDDRPASLSHDYADMRDVISHLIEKYSLQDRILVLLQPTTPLRSQKHIEDAIRLYLTGKYSMVMSIMEADNRCLKYGFNESGTFSHINKPAYCFTNRQKLPKVFAPNGAIYVFRGADFMVENQFPVNSIGTLEMSNCTSIDIDQEEDFVAAEKIMKG